MDIIDNKEDIKKELKYLVRLNEIEKYINNPFYQELNGKMYIQPRANTIIAKNQALVDTETGEVIRDEQMLIGKRKYVDRSHFAKIYFTEIGEILSLSPRAIKLLIYISKIMDYEQKAYLNYNKIHEKVGYRNYHQVLTGVRELLTKKIIAASDMEHWYWINPIYICKGERFSKYTEYVLKPDNHSSVDYSNSSLAKKGIEIQSIQEKQIEAMKNKMRDVSS